VLIKPEEERRFVYVATPRTMATLIITYRKLQIGEPITVLSRFLGELGG
jgi:superfamily I DNA/RNA helicase